MRNKIKITIMVILIILTVIIFINHAMERVDAAELKEFHVIAQDEIGNQYEDVPELSEMLFEMTQTHALPETSTTQLLFFEIEKITTDSLKTESLYKNSNQSMISTAMDSTNTSGLIVQITNAKLEKEEQEKVLGVEKCEGIRYVKADVLNVRSGPSVEDKIIGKLYTNDIVELVSKNNTEFYEIKYDNKVGYVHRDYLSEKRIERTTAQKIVDAAYSQLGTPYRWGGTTPYRGLDCSGLVQYCYATVGISIPRTSYSQASGGKNVGSLSNALPGDIICYDGHVGIYIGNKQMIHAPQTGEVVKISSVYRTKTIIAIKRYW